MRANKNELAKFERLLLTWNNIGKKLELAYLNIIRNKNKIEEKNKLMSDHSSRNTVTPSVDEPTGKKSLISHVDKRSTRFRSTPFSGSKRLSKNKQIKCGKTKPKKTNKVAGTISKRKIISREKKDKVVYPRNSSLQKSQNLTIATVAKHVTRQAEQDQPSILSPASLSTVVQEKLSAITTISSVSPEQSPKRDLSLHDSHTRKPSKDQRLLDCVREIIRRGKLTQ
ncbi:unnamed protein product [Didymodactylos carnosus]|uniref:Uncharacterized protein n=1 Tax=Didymodactylos carnosus TaxID=1234261 RepID=A0A813XDF3_9BILA|nr:unnamed protein product [Didymodactylos carnosus]CAF0871473.1 unnamed protein product [Didymodactylos carnosus]CAF3603489.1 unnamed protein product [Didymodactylos carnosus]CAF3658785.1 unnamed protein product [Didymodactylos carnosus]